MKKKILFLPLSLLCLTACDLGSFGFGTSIQTTSSDDKSIIIYNSSNNSEGDSSKRGSESSSDTRGEASSNYNNSSSSSSKGDSKTSSSNSNSVSSESSSKIELSEHDYGDFKVTTQDGSVTLDGSIINITKAGTYEISGTLSEGYIYVNAGDDDSVILNLNNVSITSTQNSPIYVLNADEVEIHSNNGNVNYLNDNRNQKTADDDTQGNGALYSKCDMSLTGKGSLSVVANYNNGIHSTKDLKIKNNVITVKSCNNALKGNDSVEIKSGTLTLISSGGNGISTEDTDVSDKGNQRGSVTISGGKINIYSCKDGIDAAYDAVVTNTTEKDGSITIPEINIYTSNYSQYSGEVVSSSGTTKYIKTSNSTSTVYRYAIYYLNNDSYYWADCSYFTSQTEGSSSYGGPSGGRGTKYYYYKYDLPSTAVAIQLYCFTSSQSNSTETYKYKTEMINVNTNYDTVIFTLSSDSMSFSSWTTYTVSTNQGGMGPGGGGFNPGGMQEGNNDKADYSAKGIKASNEINISGGKFYIKAYDDAIHANYGDTLENEATGKGDVIISDGEFEIYAADDAIHADRYLTISGGKINITSSYEGIEANVITFSGGETTVYSTDDGVNAAKKANLSPQIIVTGGKVDITVASGDTDGIDSNGSFTQSGGVVITRGSGGNMSTGLDTDGTASISGGTFIAFGKTESKLTTSGSVKTQTITATFSTGTYTFTLGETSITTTNSKMSYSNVYIYSDLGNTFSYSKK